MDTLDLFSPGGDAQSGEEVEEELTAAEVLAKLQDAWSNEKHCPTLLTPCMEVVECMQEQLNTMEQNLAKLGKGDIRVGVHRMELQRIKFMINSYLRLRLDKIQSQVWHYSESEDTGEKLTNEEMVFVANYKEMLLTHFKTLALQHLPGGWDVSSLDPGASRPNFNQAVFASVVKDCLGLEMEDPTDCGRDQLVDLKQGDQHLIMYSAVKELVEEGSIKLI